MLHSWHLARTRLPLIPLAHSRLCRRPYFNSAAILQRNPLVPGLPAPEISTHTPEPEAAHGHLVDIFQPVHVPLVRRVFVAGPGHRSRVSIMAPQELSSNWKNLQAKIKAESSTSSSSSKPQPGSKPSTSLKRKASESNLNKAPSHPPAKKIQTRHPYSKPKQISTSSATTNTNNNKKAQEEKGMGNTQSSKTDPLSVLPNASKNGITPSLSLWAQENDISPEDLAEAYQLGLGSSGRPGDLETPRPNEGLAPNVSLDKAKYLALDCEMVGVGEGGHESALARVSIVDFHGRQVYDSFVRPKERVTDWRTEYSGVSPKNMPTARSFEEVQSQVAELLKGRILVGHDVRHDLAVLSLEHSPRLIRDTAKFPGFKKYGNGRKPSLRVLAQELLGLEIQTGQHSSIEDARATMMLFRKHKAAFDVDHANRYPDEAPRKLKGKPNKSKKKK